VAIRPVRAVDDGVQTRLKFSSHAEFPTIYVENDDKSESLVNFTVEQDEVVIHRVARQFVLRRGRLVGCLQNRSFDGGGERLPSETVVPGVVRETKGAGR
jgi:type IV secretion system protein VirB9